MDINNNQQINTFIKGMDTDTSDMYMGEGQYRYAENLRVVTDTDNNSGELHVIEGTNKVFDITPIEESSDEYVDLGLPSGLKWAKCNIGANNSYESGRFFQWANTTGYLEGESHDFSPSSYQMTNGQWCNDDIQPDIFYDASVVALGNPWRMPTRAEFVELVENTTQTWVEDYQNSGMNGTLFTASNNNSIFLPAAGYRLGNGTPIEKTTRGSYWASSYDSSEDEGFKLDVSQSGVNCHSNARYYGQTIRPVYDKQAGNEILLGYTTIRNYIITVVYRASIIHSRPVGEWAIFRYDSDDNFNKVMVAGWFTEKIWPDDWDQNHNTKPLSLVTRWESKDNIKLYIANGITELLVINVAKSQDGQYEGQGFDAVFKSISTPLAPIIAEKTNIENAHIPGVVIQYGYVVYNVNRDQSSLSILSNIINQSKDNVHGHKVDENSNHVIKITLPENIIGKRIKIYRVAYSRAGQLPRVDIIYDQICIQNSIHDLGRSLGSVSSSEFIATNKLLFVPKEIESKGDYLFAANLVYKQDEIDRQFKKFDARSYSRGNYYVKSLNGISTNVDILDTNLTDDEQDGVFKNLTDKELKHHQFDDEAPFDVNYWKQVTSNNIGVNGHGLCFDWKYVFSDDQLYYTKQYDGETPRTYARNEVYRFGVRLYDSQGRASSVKWIADIKMPLFADAPANLDNGNIKNYVTNDPTSAVGLRDYLIAHNISIQFIPRNVDKDYWNGVSKYEIVQAKRSIEDSYKITQGIVGFPMQIDNDELCLPYFLTTSPFHICRGFTYDGRYTVVDNVDDYYLYRQFLNSLIFASPEYSYQPDDIKNIIQNYKSNINCEVVARWQRLSTYITNTTDFNMQCSYNTTYNNEQTHYLKYYTAYHNTSNFPTSNGLYKLSAEGTDLRIQVGFTNSQSGPDSSLDRAYGEYFLSSQVMQEANQDSRQGVDAFGEGVHGGISNPVTIDTKYVYFTNMYAQDLNVVSLSSKKINDVEFIQENSGDQFAKDEWPTFKNKFNTLRNGKKFFNWTNPAMLDSQIFSQYTGGDDDTTDSWLRTTCQSRESFGGLALKYNQYVDDPGNNYFWQRAVRGSLGLVFPISPGGPNMVLDVTGFENIRPTYGSELFYNSTSSTANMPNITIANITKPASPYGGYSISAINNTQYLSFGYCADKNNSVTISAGDNYITMFIYYLYHNIDNKTHDNFKSAAIQYIVPIESTMDLSKQCSNYLQAIESDTLPIGGTKNGVWVQVHPDTVAGRFTQTTDVYMYNTAHSVIPDVVSYAAEDTINAANPLYDSRIHYSQKKQNNELIDNWTNFKAIDYLDVDSRYGSITGLKLFKDKLIFLQENGAGVLSVNDRTILKDQESANIIVGNGGVLDRYDYFTTMYGMKPDQHVVEASNDALYWWDGHRKEILSYVDGYNVNLLQRIKNVSNYINSGTESDTPSIVYDVNNKEVLFNVVNNKCAVYNEQTQQFTSIYTFDPIYYSNIDGKVFLTNSWNGKERLYEYNKNNECDAQGPKLFENKRTPKLKYVVNKDSIYNKTFDMQTFGGRFYGGSAVQTENDTDKHLVKGEHNNNPLTALTFTYNTPTKQQSTANGSQVTNREYDYRLTIPRNHDDLWGGRMRGKTMECTLESNSNNSDFSIQYIVTKYRMSWS